MTKVKDILNQKGNTIWHITPQTKLSDALNVLCDKDIGAVLILEGKKVVGIFSERDYVRESAHNKQLSPDMPVREIMTEIVFSVTPDKGLEECMSLITDKHIRHLPVIENDELVGIISIGDIVSKIIREQESSINHLENYITGQYH